MTRSTNLAIGWLLVALLLAGCGSRQAPYEARTAATSGEVPAPAAGGSRVERIDAALRSASEYLVRRQSDDGAWRSDVYGPFKEGDALTALVLTALADANEGNGDTAAAIERGTAYLVGMTGPAGEVRPPRHGLAYPIYTSAGSAIVLSRSHDAAHEAARNGWLQYLRERQLTEALGWRPGDPEYGGWGYASEPTVRPPGGGPLGDLAEPNLSATVFALAALRASGAAVDDPAVRKALAFVERCQNFETDASARDASFDDGGFVFVLDDPVRNKAGVAGTDRRGRQRFASYGSATADGLRALTLCGAAIDSPRVQATWAWIERNFDAEHHPGAYTADRASARPAVYFYYCHSLLEALAAASPSGPAAANTQRWAAAIADALLARQRPDASWKNHAVDVREDDPLVATSLAASALARCSELLATGQPRNARRVAPR